MEIPLLQIVNTLTDLKAQVPVGEALLIGRDSVTDGKGGFYRWDATSTDTEDTAYLNVVQSSQTTTGRWVRIFQKAKTYPQGPLVNNGGVKTLFIPNAVTDSNGEITFNITDDNTATGNALFTEIWSIIPQPQVNATGPASAVQSYRKSLAANLKTATYGFYKANAVTITLGMLLTPVASIGAGTSVAFRIEGI